MQALRLYLGKPERTLELKGCTAGVEAWYSREDTLEPQGHAMRHLLNPEVYSDRPDFHFSRSGGHVKGKWS